MALDVYRDRWLEVGRNNPWICHACDPPFDEASFRECADAEELLDLFAHGNWALGVAFCLGDLCFIQQVNGGDEWLTIKQGTAFESISWGWILHNQGRQAGRELLARLVQASVPQCRRLEY